MTNVKYQLKYQYYHYNTGDANNGSFIDFIEFENYEELMNEHEKISKSINNNLDMEENKNLNNKYFNGDGYFEKIISLNKVITKEINLNYNDNYVKYLYQSDIDGSELDVNKDLVDNIISSYDWLIDKVNTLWKIYDEMNGLNEHMVSFNIFKENIIINSSYYSRGFEYKNQYLLNESWLYMKDPKIEMKKHLIRKGK